MSDPVYQEKVNLHKGINDIEAVEKFAAEHPEDVFYRAPTEEATLLFVYQNKYQKRLLHRYWNAMVFLDGTCKTTRYTMPIFLLVVKTNVGYLPAAAFIIQREDTWSIQDALGILADNNPGWRPSVVMLDCYQKVEGAVKATFPVKFRLSVAG